MLISYLQQKNEQKDVFLLIKLQAHFKDVKTKSNRSNSSTLSNKSKEKWKFKKTYHTVNTCIDLAENEIIDWKNGENE